VSAMTRLLPTEAMFNKPSPHMPLAPLGGIAVQSKVGGGVLLIVGGDVPTAIVSFSPPVTDPGVRVGAIVGRILQPTIPTKQVRPSGHSEVSPLGHCCW